MNRATGLVELHFRHEALTNQTTDTLEDQVGVDRLDAITDQDREMMDFPWFTRFQHQSHPGTVAVTDQVVVDTGAGQ